MRSTALLLIAVLLAAASGCKHEPLNPVVDGNTPPDTTEGCDPNTVYFVNDVLPIFNSSCAMSGCHNAASAQDGVVLDTYANIMNTGEVSPGNPGNSEIYEVITEDDADKLMPPPSSGITLTQEQINTIYNWIASGAQNDVCAQTSACDTANVSFAADVQPILSTYCLGCHSGGSPQGGIALNGYANVLLQANNGRLVGSIDHLPAFSPMPQGQSKLSDCNIALIRNWVAQGASDN